MKPKRTNLPMTYSGPIVGLKMLSIPELISCSAFRALAKQVENFSYTVSFREHRVLIAFVANHGH